MFRTGIMPKWEDEVNIKGGEFKVDLSGIRDPQSLQKIWEMLVFGCITGNIPKVKEGIAGVRFIQKVKNNAL